MSEVAQMLTDNQRTIKQSFSQLQNHMQSQQPPGSSWQQVFQSQRLIGSFQVGSNMELGGYGSQQQPSGSSQGQQWPVGVQQAQPTSQMQAQPPAQGIQRFPQAVQQPGGSQGASSVQIAQRRPNNSQLGGPQTPNAGQQPPPSQ